MILDPSPERTILVDESEVRRVKIDHLVISKPKKLLNVPGEVTISDVTTHSIPTLPKYFTLKFDAFIAAPSGSVDSF